MTTAKDKEMKKEKIGRCAWCGLVDHRLDEFHQCSQCKKKAVTHSKIGDQVKPWGQDRGKE